MYEGWDSSGIHAFKDVPLEELPEEAVVILADSLTQAYVPTINKVRSKYSFRRVREHRGTDIALSTGDSIRSAFDGVVRVKEVTRNTGGYGNLLVIRHPNGLETYYGHLSRFLVDTGEVVKAGEVIGLGGNTGRSTGPHLHFETRYMGKAFDPERVFDFEQERYVIPYWYSKSTISAFIPITDKRTKSRWPLRSASYILIRPGDTLGRWPSNTALRSTSFANGTASRPKPP